jgi:hypothetical protein
VDSTGKGPSPFNLKDFFEKAGRYFETVYEDGIPFALNPSHKPVITDDMEELDRATVQA